MRQVSVFYTVHFYLMFHLRDSISYHIYDNMVPNGDIKSVHTGKYEQYSTIMSITDNDKGLENI